MMRCSKGHLTLFLYVSCFSLCFSATKTSELQILIEHQNDVVIEAEQKVLASEKMSEELLKPLNEISSFDDDRLDKSHHLFFRRILLKARALNCLGKVAQCLGILDRFSEEFTKADTEIEQKINDDKKYLEKDKERIKAAASFKAGIHYTKGMSLLLKSIDVKESGYDKKADLLLLGDDGALDYFKLCLEQNKDSLEYFYSIIRYYQCQQLAKKWFGKELKNLSISNLDHGKAYYSVKQYAKAVKYFDAYKDKEATQSGYDAMYYIIPSLVKSDQINNVDEYLNILRKKYIKFDIEPKNYVTKIHLYMSGVYKKMMEETKDELKKKEYDKIRTNYYLAVYRPSHNEADIHYLLALKNFSKAFELHKLNKIDDAKSQYEHAIWAFEELVKKHPDSLEATKAFEKMGQLHEYFKIFDQAAKMYHAYAERKPITNEADQIDKISILYNVAALYFIQEQFAQALRQLNQIEDIISNQDFSKVDDRNKMTLRNLKNNIHLLRKSINEKSLKIQ
ncbi:MAG: hypothetical protein NE334_01145 [Lentisphaeraceae bacterium]|nr:hypothetical protein [Lentisphaeraceae bacterium]